MTYQIITQSERGVSVEIHYNTDEPQKTSGRKARHKRSQNDSVYMKYPKQVNSQRQNADWWLEGRWGNAEQLLSGSEFPFGVMEVFWGDGGVLELDRGGSYTIL